MMINRSWAPLLAAAVVTIGACKKTEVSSAPVGHADLSAQAVGITNDTQTLANVQVAAGDVIRNASDCDKVREFAPDALRAIAEADKRVQTATGHVTLDSLKKQVDAVVQGCP
jgi:hypothetical protein